MRFERMAVTGGQAQAERPVLDAYLLDTVEESPYFHTRPAVIICPGGAYRFTSEREAEAVAMRFLAAGFHAFILWYSVAPARFPVALTEAANAVKTVRQHAAEWKVSADQIYIMGFSAGGHLACSLGTLWDHPLLAQAMGHTAGEKLWKPDGMLLCYPVITMGMFTHGGSRDNLLGENPPDALASLLSLETQVSAGTVPAFLWHTATDDSVPVENTLQFTAAMRKAGVPFELHIYESGPHGISLCDETTSYDTKQMQPDAAGWMALAIAWVNRRRGPVHAG